MSNEYGEKLRSIGFAKHKGTTRTTPVVAEEGPRRGTVVGSHTEHWNGRIDATASAPTITVDTTVRED